MLIRRKSPRTGKVTTKEINVTQEQLDAWQAGETIQTAMPQVNADDREFIISGLTLEDWAEMFPEPDPDEYYE